MDAPEVEDPVIPKITGEVTGEVTAEVTGEVTRFIIALNQQTLSREEAQLRLGLKSQANFRDRYLMPALAASLIERTLPDKPNSRLQKYRLTAQGRAFLEADRERIESLTPKPSAKKKPAPRKKRA